MLEFDMGVYVLARKERIPPWKVGNRLGDPRTRLPPSTIKNGSVHINLTWSRHCTPIFCKIVVFIRSEPALFKLLPIKAVFRLYHQRSRFPLTFLQDPHIYETVTVIFLQYVIHLSQFIHIYPTLRNQRLAKGRYQVAYKRLCYSIYRGAEIQ